VSSKTLEKAILFPQELQSTVPYGSPSLLLMKNPFPPEKKKKGKKKK